LAGIFENSMWLNVSEEPADKRITGSSRILERKTLGKFLCGTKCNWESQQAETVRSLEDGEEGVEEFYTEILFL
jgi:hypothetical protein